MAAGDRKRLEAEKAWVEHGEAPGAIAQRLGVHRNTVANWARAGDWDAQREQFLCRIVQKVAVAREEAIEQAATEAAGAIMSAVEVLIELSRIGRGNMRRVASWGPGGVKLKESDALTDDEAAIVAEAGETRTKDGGSIKVKLYDKLSALDKLAKHHGLLEAAPSDGKGALDEPAGPDPAPDLDALDAAELTRLYREAAAPQDQVQ